MIQQSYSWAYIWIKTWFKRIHAPVFIVALSTIVKTWKQTQCPLTDEWIKKMWCVYIYIYIHTLEYYPLKRME